MPIIQSTITRTSIQTDGRVYVTEEHKHSNGRVYTHEYLADPALDRNAVLTARAVNIGAAIDMQIAVEAEAANFEIPLSRVEILSRITDDEYAAMEASNNKTMKRGWAMFKLAQVIYRSDLRTQQMFALAESLNIIAPGRAAVILA